MPDLFRIAKRHANLQVPWANLGRSPVIITIDRLYILAGPKTEEPSGEEEQYEVSDGFHAGLAH